jgi:rubrerythrin
MKAEVWTEAELMAIAAEIECRDVDHYRELVRLVGQGDENTTLCLEGLIADKTQHLQAIREWADKVGVNLISDAARFRDLPFDPRAGEEDWGDPALRGPYLVLAKATAEKTRAFRFYSYFAAEATDPAVKALAESFAREELARAGELRALRRRAWRREGRRRRHWRDLLASLDDAKAANVARVIEARVAAKIEQLAAGAETPAETAKKLLEAASVLRAAAGAAPDLSADIADLVFIPLTAHSSIDRARQLLERLFEISIMAAKFAPSEAIIRLAQKSAATLVASLEKLGPAAKE